MTSRKWYFVTESILTHWGRVMHIWVCKLTIISSDNGLSPGRRQAIIWTNDGILLNEPLGTNFSENLIEIHTFSLKKIDLKISSGKRQPSCLGLNVLMSWSHQAVYKQMCIVKSWIFFLNSYLNQSPYEIVQIILFQWLEFELHFILKIWFRCINALTVISLTQSWWPCKAWLGPR